MFSARLVKLHPKNKEIYLFDKEGVAPQLPQVECCFLMFIRKTDMSTIVEIFESKPIKLVEHYPDEDVYEFVTADGTYNLFIQDNRSEDLPIEEAA